MSKKELKEEGGGAGEESAVLGEFRWLEVCLIKNQIRKCYSSAKKEKEKKHINAYNTVNIHIKALDLAGINGPDTSAG